MSDQTPTDPWQNVKWRMEDGVFVYPASDVDDARALTDEQHQRDLSQRDETIRQLQAQIAELHDIVSGYDAITNPEEQPELHARAFAALGEGADHTICRALEAAEARCVSVTQERVVSQFQERPRCN